MQGNTDRDRSVERLLRSTLPGSQASGNASDACVDAETVAAWAAGALPRATAALVETHLAACERCQALLAAFARTPVEPAAAAPSLYERWRLRWLVPIAAAATTVAIWIAIPSDQRPPLSREAAIPAETPTPPPEQPVLVLPAAPDAPAPKPEEPADLGSTGAAARPAEKEADAAVSAEIGAERAAVTELRGMPAATQQPRDETAASPAGSRPPASAALESGAAIMARQAVMPPVEIVSPNPVNRWRVLGGTRVERSTNTGTSWEPAIIQGGTVISGGSSPEPLVCWLVGPAGAVRVTTDGIRFDSVPFPEAADLVSVRASSATIAVVTTIDGRQFRTDDRGSSWSRVTP